MDPYLVLKQCGETVTLNRIESGSDKSGRYSTEEVPCHDPLVLIQAELEQYRLVTPLGITHDKLPRFHGGPVSYLPSDTTSRFQHPPLPHQTALTLPHPIICSLHT